MAAILAEIIEKARYYCTYQERCHAEVRNKLYELGCNTSTVNEIMAQLIESNYLNEERFAKAYAGGKFRTKKWGRVKIKRELVARKISDYCISSAMREIDETDYWDCLTTLVNKKLPENPSWEDEQKVIRWLMAKGYETDLILEAVKNKEKN